MAEQLRGNQGEGQKASREANAGDPKQPAKTFRVRYVRAAVWANPGEYGPMYSVQFSRGYKDGDEWKAATSFGRDDLLVLAEVARMAFHWIASQGGKVGEGAIAGGEELPFWQS